MQEELDRYHPSLRQKDQMIVINKIDLVPADSAGVEHACRAFRDMGYKCVAISALTGKGMNDLKDLLETRVLAQLSCQ